MVLSNLIGIEFVNLWFFTHRVGQFSKGTEDARSVDFSLSSLEAQTKLDSEPVDGCQAVNLPFVGPQRGKSDLLGKVREFFVSEHRRVAQQLMDDVGLGCVVWATVMADILSRVEHSESQSIQELSLSEEPTDGSESPSSGLLEVL